MIDRTSRTALLAALAAMIAGAAWILATHETAPLRGLHYHVPLAGIFAAWAVECVAQAREQRRARPLVAPLLGLASGLLRLLRWGPFSGHAVIGALVLTTARRPILRLLGAGLILQAFVTKLLLAEDPPAAIWGGLLGAGLGLLLRNRTPAASAPTPDQGRIENSMPARKT